MGLEALAYPFLFVVIFFESFVLVTLLSKPARVARARTPGTTIPSVAVIVPCWNEMDTIAGTCQSLLALDYPKDKLELILVDDGSTDETLKRLREFEGHPQVRVIHKENGGKHTALNAGIAVTNAEFVGCLDADSFVDPQALREVIACFADPVVAAATSAMSIYQPKTVIQHMQNAEYTLGILMRHVLSSINGLYVTPGPFSFYRRSVVNELGGFRYGHQTEDMEMALRIQQAGYWIENAPRARVYTKAPPTISKLLQQRTRWTTGFLRNILGEYRGLIFNIQHKSLGLLVLPSAILAIGGSILIFCVALYKIIETIVSLIEVRSGIPLSYALTPHNPFNLLYLPLNIPLLLGITVLCISLTLILVGKRLSATPGPLRTGLIAYTFLYGLIAPLWLIRATVDATTGKHRGWR